MVFSRQSFSHARIQNVLVILFVPYKIFQAKIILFLLWTQAREQFWRFLSDKENLRQLEKNLGRAPETVEKPKLNSSCEAEEKLTIQKMN